MEHVLLVCVKALRLFLEFLQKFGTKRALHLAGTPGWHAVLFACIFAAVIFYCLDAPIASSYS